MTPTWSKNDVSLYLGDCREILPTLGKVDAVITDPPYGVEFSGKVTKRKVEVGGYQSITDNEEYLDSVVLPVVIDATLNAKRAAVFTGIRNIKNYPKATDMGGVFCGNGTGRGPWGFTCFNPVLFYGKCPYLTAGKGSRPTSYRATGAGDDGLAFDCEHPCPKPLEWMLWLVERTSTYQETILDPFMGSGTTGVAAVRLGRKFIGIEIEPKYFEIAQRRIEAAMDETSLLDYAQSVSHQMEITTP